MAARIPRAVGHVPGSAAGLLETDRLREVLGERHRWHAVRGHMHELDVREHLLATGIRSGLLFLRAEP